MPDPTLASCGLCGRAWTGDGAIGKLADHMRAAHTSKPKAKAKA